MRLDSNSSSNPERIAVVSVSRGMDGGAEVVLRNLLMAYKQPEQLVLLSPDGCGLETAAKARGIRWVEIPAVADTFLSNLIGFRKAMRSAGRVALLHAWTRRAFELVALAGGWRRVPCLATLHDHPRAIYISRARRLLMRLAAKRINPLVCVSEHQRAALGGLYTAADAVVIPNGVRDFHLGLRPTTGKSNITVGFAGMHHPHKGFPIVASWIRDLLGRGLRVDFELFGEVHPEWIAMADELEHSFRGRVRLRGKVSVEEIFRDIDVLVQASYPVVETFGMVFAEAACAGIPVVTSGHGAEGEVVRDCETGFLFQPTCPEIGLNRLTSLLLDVELRKTMGRRARLHFESNFRSEVMADRYSALWSAAANTSRARHMVAGPR